jgi:dihydropteroate synthase
VDAKEELARVRPAVAELTGHGVAVSVDTTRARVAAAAVAAGAVRVNDVSAGLADPDITRLMADAGAPWLLMHWRGHSADMDAAAG